jgi:hypothetical protein
MLAQPGELPVRLAAIEALGRKEIDVHGRARP